MGVPIGFNALADEAEVQFNSGYYQESASQWRNARKQAADISQQGQADSGEAESSFMGGVTPIEGLKGMADRGLQLHSQALAAETDPNYIPNRLRDHFRSALVAGQLTMYLALQTATRKGLKSSVVEIGLEEARRNFAAAQESWQKLGPREGSNNPHGLGRFMRLSAWMALANAFDRNRDKEVVERDASAVRGVAKIGGRDFRVAALALCVNRFVTSEDSLSNRAAVRLATAPGLLRPGRRLILPTDS